MPKYASSIVICLSVVLILSLMNYFGVVGGLLFIPLILGLYALGNPRLLVFAYFGFISFAGMIVANVPLNLIDYFDEMLLAALAVSVALHILLKHFHAGKMTVISVHFSGLFFVTLLSWYVNRPSVIQLIHFIMTYLSFIPMFYAGVLLRRHFCSSDPLKWLAYLLPVNLVLNVMWLVGVNPLPNRQWLFYDRAIGIFYDSHMLGYCMMFQMVFIVSVWLNEYDKSSRLRYSILLGATLLQYLLTFVMHTIPLLLLLLLLGVLWFWKEHARRIGQVISLGVLALLAMSLVVLAIDAQILHQVQKDMTWKRIRPYVLRVRHSPKGVVYAHVFRNAPRNLYHRLLGFGPGNFASVVGVQYTSSHTQHYVSYLFDSYEGRRLWKGTSFIENPQTGVTGVFSEIGWLGGLLYFVVHFVAISHFAIAIKRKRFKNPPDVAAAQGWILMVLGYLILSFVWDVFRFDLFRSGLWFWAGLLWNSDDNAVQQEA